MITLALASLLYWSDADSGRLPDGTKFRLHGIDAPETYRPQCEAERIAGYEAKEAIIEMTQDADVQVTHTHYTDRYGRVVVDLYINGVDLADTLVELGHAKDWDYGGGESKPEWCE